MPIVNENELEVQHFSAHGGEGEMHIGFAFKDAAGYGNHNDSGWSFFGIAELPVGATAGLHTHTGEDEFFYVLDGEAVLIQDGQEVVAKKGDIVLTRSGSTHGIKSVKQAFRFITLEIYRKDQVKHD